jgi:hypothetical protein
MKKKISIIERVERRKKQEKNKQNNLIVISSGEERSNFSESYLNTIVLRRLDKANKQFEIIE